MLGMGVLGIYVGVFVLLVLDSIVFRTHFVDRWIPERLWIPMRILFYPLLLVTKWLGLIPELPPIH